MKNKSLKISGAAVGLIACLSLFAAGCGSDDDDADAIVTDTTVQLTTATTQDPGPANAPGFDGETIKLGFLTDLSGGLSSIGEPIRDGAQVYWDYVNEELGGIAGKYKVELVVEDTQDTADVAVQGYLKIKNDVVMIAEILSTGPTDTVLSQLKVDGIVAVPGSLAGQWVTERYLLPNGAPYQYEMINIVDWWHSTQSDGNDVYCSMAVDDKYGEDTISGFIYVAEELGIEIAAQETMNRNDNSFVAQLTALEDAGCTVVVAATLPIEQNTMLSQALGMGYTPVWLGALPAYLNNFGTVEALAPSYANFYVALDAPSLADDSIEGIRNYKARYEQYKGGTPGTFALSGYFQSFSVHALLEKAVELGDLSREGILAALAELGEVDVEGLAASNFVYGEPQDRVAPRASRIFEHDISVEFDALNEVTIYESEHIPGFDLSG